MAEEKKAAQPAKEVAQPAKKVAPVEKKPQFRATAVNLTHPFTKAKFDVRDYLEHDKDGWVKGQIKAGMLKEG